MSSDPRQMDASAYDDGASMYLCEHRRVGYIVVIAVSMASGVLGALAMWVAL